MDGPEGDVDVDVHDGGTVCTRFSDYTHSRRNFFVPPSPPFAFVPSRETENRENPLSAAAATFNLGHLSLPLGFAVS